MRRDGAGLAKQCFGELAGVAVGHGRNGQGQHVVHRVVGVSGLAQGSKYEVQTERAGEQEAQTVGAGEPQGTQMIQQLDGRILSRFALEVVEHERELVPKHEDAHVVVGDVDEMVEGLGEEDLPTRVGSR